MSFMQEVLIQNIPIWDKCADTPFLRKMQAGTLPIDCFKEYMIQDSIYLKHYARVYGKAIYHATSLRDIQVYYSMLSFVGDTESTVRLHYLSQFGMTDDDIELIAQLPENRQYIDFLLEIAEQGNECEIIMAVLPCMLSYSYIFRKLAAQPNSKKSKYWDFINDYADDIYAKSCKEWCDFADSKCENLNSEEQEKLRDIFKKGSMLEFAFWNMAYSQDTH